MLEMSRQSRYFRVRFTFANVCLAMVVIAISLAWCIDRHRLLDRLTDANRQHALDALATCRADVTFDRAGNPTKVDFYPTRCIDRDVQNLKYLPTVREVNLAYCYDISDE